MPKYYETKNGFESAHGLNARKRKIEEWKKEQARLQRWIDFYQGVIDSAKGPYEN